MNKHNPLVTILVVAAIVAAFVMIPKLSNQAQTLKEYEYYSDFMADLDAGNIATMRVTGGKRVEGEFRPDAFVAGGQAFEKYKAQAELDAQTIAQLIEQHPEVQIAPVAGSWTDNLLGMVGAFIVPVIVLLVFWLLVPLLPPLR